MGRDEAKGNPRELLCVHIYKTMRQGNEIVILGATAVARGRLRGRTLNPSAAHNTTTMFPHSREASVAGGCRLAPIDCS